jgi:acyl-CoA thioester hydrolase
MNKEQFELPITVVPADIDQIGHVNNIVYLRWVQDAAVAHWRARASEADQAALLWVVVRHTIEYKRPAMNGDKIIVRTWIGNASRCQFERHTEIIRARDQRLLATSLTVWCPIDAKTLKPTIVSDEVRKRFSASSADFPREAGKQVP